MFHHRPAAVFLTIDETLASTPAVACAALSASSRCSRRILANVSRRSVSQLGMYRNEGSRIDFMWPYISSARIEYSPTDFSRTFCNHA